MRFLGNLLIAASLLGAVVVGLLAAEVTPPWALESPVPVDAAPSLSASGPAMAPPPSAPAVATGMTAGVPVAPVTGMAAAPSGAAAEARGGHRAVSGAG